MSCTRAKESRWAVVAGGARRIPDAIVKAVTDWVNARWQYDPTRPRLLVCYSAPHGTGRHLHFQVHERTRAVPPT